MDEFFKKMLEDAKKQQIQEEVEKKIDEDSEYQEKARLIDIQLDLLKNKKEELLKEKVSLRAEIGNRILKDMGSKYRIQLKDKGVFGGF